ncbi:serine hydrolase domain-containing protein [Streptomyces sp. NPDC059101]|uniref:serine hydrolase domain-containing protein n=1 Tax=Streptomyces sp. NPDC059101 TaxID=3346728 RepID=UPI0036BAC244
MTAITDAEAARLHETLTTVVDDGATPGGVIICGTPDQQPHVLTAGVIVPELGEAAPGATTVYDLASLTKVVATWPMIGQAVAEGRVELDAPVRAYLPPMAGRAPSGEATIRQLLTHTSGLRASTRLDHYRGETAPLHELLCREPLEGTPGEHRYINRGYILLGLALSHVHGRPLHEIAADMWHGMGLGATQFGPVGRGANVAPTEQRLSGAPRIWGAAHDENAALLGGVAGHAGVFSTAADLATYAQWLLRSYPKNESGAWLRSSLEPQATIEPGIERGLSWIIAGGRQVAYHHGWTGTSLYLAPASGRYLVLCTNAVYGGAARTRIRPVRDLALKTLSVP